MAVDFYSHKLSESKFKNWIKAGLGVLYTKEGIEPFVYDEIEKFQEKCLSDICNKNGLAASTTCSSCCTENVVVCPTDRICNVGRGKCSFHRNTATQYLPSGCPNKICHNFKNEIQNAHRFYGPSYKNSDATQWCNNPWEVAKCFMPPDGYKEVTSAAEADFNGINSVIINYKAFQSKVNDDLSKRNNIFNKAREVEKAVRHSSYLGMEDEDLQQNFSILQNLLSDPGYLATNSTSQNAKKKLSQLQNDTLIIGIKDIRKVLEDVSKAVEDELRTDKDEHTKKAEKQKLELIKITHKSISAFERQEKLSMSELDKALQSAVDETEVHKKDRIIEDHSTQKKHQHEAEDVDTVPSDMDLVTIAGAIGLNWELLGPHLGLTKTMIDHIKMDNDTSQKRIYQMLYNWREDQGPSSTKRNLFTAFINQPSTNIDWESLGQSFPGATKYKPREEKTNPKVQTAEDAYIQRKEQLKDDLAAFYKTRYSTIPLSPLFEENDTPLVDFYILPEMNFIEVQKKKPAGEETKTSVRSLSDVFKSDKGCEIYLTADAGFGKTAFSKYLAVTWCQSHRSEKKYKKYFSEDAINAMRDFEFLFLVLLRDSSDDCSIDDLLVNQIMQYLSRCSTMTIDSLQEILHRERCLVILDGLDEWTHPEKKCTKVPKMIPHRNAREKCVILTTTRPWKLGVLKLKTSEIDKKVELVKLTPESAQTLQERAISKIKKLDVAEANNLAKQLNEKIKENKLEDLESVPLLTMYLICLWCDDIPLGQSKCDLYASIIELLLSRTISKYPEMELTCETSKSDIPKCFSGHKHCTKHFTYLKTLGQLAFVTLFSVKKENTLVFDQSVADKYLSPDSLKLSLHAGLLTQSTEKKLTKQISKLSFSHKTVQESLCALYICCQNESDIKKIVEKNCKSLQSILDMSTVFVFISGMNAEIMSSISRELMSMISEDKITSDYRSVTDEYCKPLEDIQEMYISCIKENTSDKELEVFCQDFFFGEDCKEEKYFSHLTSLARHNKENMESININTRHGGPSLREIIGSCSLNEAFNINKIYYWGQGEQVQLPVLLNRSTKCVTVISFVRDSWTREMFDTLQNNSLLQAIHIYNFKMSHDVLNDFLNYIINRKTLTEIRLWYLSCTEHDCSCTFSFDFCQHSDLRRLVLRGIPEVSHLKVNSHVKYVQLRNINLGEMSLPPEMVNIEHVYLYRVNMSASTFRDLVKVAEKLSHKVTVTIDGCNIEPEREFEDVKQYIQASQNLRVTREDGSWSVFETNVESQLKMDSVDVI